MPSKTTTPIPIRLPNEDLVALDKMVEVGGFGNRSECIRAFIQPNFVMAKTAMETKSLTKCVQARLVAEHALMTHINQMIKESEIQTEFGGDLAPA